MVAKRKPTKKCGPDQVTAGKTNEDQDIARAALRPTVQAAFTLRQCGGLYSNVELSGLVDALTEQTRASSEGNQKQAEAMLTPQAHVLDALFNRLTSIAMNAEHLDAADRYLKLALRAQSQCRATWEAISAIQNPPMAGYVAQANIARNQQINYETTRAGARENQNPPNKQLEKTDGERLEFGKEGTSVIADPAVETVEEVNRPKEPGR